MSDPFKNVTSGLQSPPTGGLQITPSNTQDLPQTVRAINVLSSGTVQVTTVDDSVLTLSVAAGIPFPIRAKRVWETGTSATAIVGLY